MNMLPNRPLSASAARHTVVLIGNGPLSRNYAKVVDSAGTVVRFNKCVGYDGFAGTKMDVLCLAIGRDTLTGRPEPHVLNAAPEYWFTCKPRLVPDRMADVLSSQRGKRMANIHYEYTHPVNLEPSSGYSAYHYVVNHFIGARVIMLGFSWQGWNGHDWDYERNFFYGRQRQFGGNVEIYQ